MANSSWTNFVPREGSSHVERMMKHQHINAERLASMFDVISTLTFVIKKYGNVISRKLSILIPV